MIHEAWIEGPSGMAGKNQLGLILRIKAGNKEATDE
jgi:hypothetical protein